MDLDGVGWDALVARATEELRAVAARRETVTYHRLVADLGVDLAGGSAEDSDRSLAALLRQVSTAEDEAGRGMLSAVVVRSSGLPAGGFFRLAAERGRDVTDRREAWQRELRRVHDAYSGRSGGPPTPN